MRHWIAGKAENLNERQKIGRRSEENFFPCRNFFLLSHAGVPIEATKSPKIWLVGGNEKRRNERLRESYKNSSEKTPTTEKLLKNTFAGSNSSSFCDRKKLKITKTMKRSFVVFFHFHHNVFLLAQEIVTLLKTFLARYLFFHLNEPFILVFFSTVKVS